MGKNLDKSEEEIKGRKKLYIGENFSQAIRGFAVYRFNILKGYYRIKTKPLRSCFNILKGYRCNSFQYP